MNNPVSVQILAAKDNLPKVVAGFGLGQCFSSLVQLQERLSGGRRGGMGCRYRGTGQALSLKAAQDAPPPLQGSYGLFSPLSLATTGHSTPSPSSSLPSLLLPGMPLPVPLPEAPNPQYPSLGLCAAGDPSPATSLSGSSEVCLQPSSPRPSPTPEARTRSTPSPGLLP